MLLNENGIRLPKDTKSAKILTHTDCDGFFSGLLLYHQLVKQGIPGNRINIEFVQYGDNDLLDKATKKNRYQALIGSDFSAYPRIDMEQNWNGFAKVLDSSSDRFEYPKGMASYESFKKYIMAKRTASFSNISDYLKKYNPNCLFFTKRNDTTVRMYIEKFIKGWKHYKGNDIVDVPEFDYISDHHVNDKGNLLSGKSGKIGATDYKSDTEHIATVSAQNLMGWEDIEVISRIDSASYKNIYETIALPEKFKGKDRKERLGIIVNALVTSIIKSNKRLAEQLIKQSQPGLISVYNNALKIAKLNQNELDILSELKKEKPDWNRINELSSTLPGHEAKKIISKRDDNKSIKPVSEISKMREKNLKNIEREKKTDLSDYKFIGNVALLHAKNMKDQPSRYLFAFLSSNGKNPAFQVKYMPGLGMIQCSASPLMSQKDKERIDLQKLGDETLEAAKERGYFKEFSYDAVKSQSGGHKAIYNISGLGILKNTVLSPNERYELKGLKNYEERRKALTSKAVKKALDKGYKGRISELDEKKSNGSSEAEKFMIDYLIKRINDEYGDIKITPSKNNIEME